MKKLEVKLSTTKIYLLIWRLAVWFSSSLAYTYQREKEEEAGIALVLKYKMVLLFSFSLIAQSLDSYL
jgi:hypothetical protein